MMNKNNVESEKHLAQKYGLSLKTVQKTKNLVEAIETLAENIGDDIKLKLVNMEIEVTPEEVIELAKQTPEIQRALMKMFEKGHVKSISEGLLKFICTS